jgi:hypothetical protein
MNLPSFLISLCLVGSLAAQKSPALNQKTAVLIIGMEVSEGVVESFDDYANLLTSKGIFVYKFYYPKASWQDIVPLANKCSFLLYSGHGCSSCGLDNEFGGMVINDFVYAQDIVNELHFENHPVIIYNHACGSAGSSASDPNDIGIKEAINRITDTALPFFMAGAAAYFSTNYYNGPEEILNSLFEGKSATEIFKVQIEYGDHVVNNKPIVNNPYFNNCNLGVSCTKELVNNSNSTVEIGYNFAYIAAPSFRFVTIEPVAKN